MIDRRKSFSLISSRDHCQRSSPSRISDTLQAEFEHAQNLSSGFVESSCAVAMTTTPWCQCSCQCSLITMKTNFLNKSLPYGLQNNATLKNSKNYLPFFVVTPYDIKTV